MVKKHREAKKIKVVILTIIVFFCCGFMVGCSFDREGAMKQQAESLLDITIPEEVKEFHFVKIQGSDEYAKPYTGYIRAEMSESIYFDFLHQLELTPGQEGEDTKYTVLLLSQLRPTKQSPIWWEPDPEANEFSSAGKFRAAKNEGWIIATYYDGHAYFKIHEEGLP